MKKFLCLALLLSLPMTAVSGTTTMAIPPCYGC